MERLQYASVSGLGKNHFVVRSRTRLLVRGHELEEVIGKIQEPLSIPGATMRLLVQSALNPGPCCIPDVAFLSKPSNKWNEQEDNRLQSKSQRLALRKEYANMKASRLTSSVAWWRQQLVQLPALHCLWFAEVSPDSTWNLSPSTSCSPPKLLSKSPKSPGPQCCVVVAAVAVQAAHGGSPG